MGRVEGAQENRMRGEEKMGVDYGDNMAKLLPGKYL